MDASRKTAVGIIAVVVIGLVVLGNRRARLPSDTRSTAAPSSALFQPGPIRRSDGRPANAGSPRPIPAQLNPKPIQLVAGVFSSAVSNRLETLIAEQTAMLEATRGLEGNALRAAAGLIRLFQERELDEMTVEFPKESRRDLQAAVDRRVTIPDGYPAPTHPLSPPTGP